LSYFWPENGYVPCGKRYGGVVASILTRSRWRAGGVWRDVPPPLVPPGEPLEPPVSGTVYGVILNVRRQVEALGPALEQPPYQHPPKAPVLYIKPPNTYLGHGGVVPVPADTPALEVNATLAIVIGLTASRVTEDEALDHVLGYAVAIDVCIPHANLHRPAIRQRCRDGFLPVGPWVVARDDVGDVDDLQVRVSVNGGEPIGYSTRELVRPVAKLIADVTDFMTLFEGDVLLAGLAPDAPLARVGDRVRAEIAGIGALECTLEPERLP
jgi:5-oxopent-3-ene-1,2,5-tricarboxylate decarboxylase/2-hydroxyhepta-2,4-diene-1,7-dioate isomerase